MDEIERRLAALGELPVDSVVPRTSQIVRKARVRRVLAATGTAAGVLVLAVAGLVAFRTLGSAPAGGDRSAFIAAQRAMTAEGTVRAEFDASLNTEGPDISHRQDIHGSSEIDFSNNRSHMINRTEAPQGTIEVIQDGGTVYQRFASSEHPDRWVMSEAASSDLSWSAPQGPMDLLESLSAVSQRVESLGREQLDSETVDHYRFEIDEDLFVEQWLGRTGAPQASLGDIDFEFEPAHVWLDSSSRVRKLSMAYAISNSGEYHFTVHARWTVRFYDFGAPVDIQIPSPDDVVEGPLPGEGPPVGPDSTFATPRPELDWSLIAGRYGTDVAYLLVSHGPGRPMLCVNNVPPWAELARVVNENTEEAVATFTADEMTISGDGQYGCGQVDRSAADGLVEVPDDYVLEIPGASPDQSVELTTARRP